MNIKQIVQALAASVAVMFFAATAQAQNRGNVRAFNPSTDLLVLGHDCKTDPDDIYAMAAFGCMLRHPDLQGVNYFGILGAYDTDRSFTDSPFIVRSPEMMAAAFGTENTKWVNADAEFNRSTKVWSTALINQIRDVVKPILNNGGIVWVAEAGHSNLTRKWVEALKAAGVTSQALKTRLVIVQHSSTNERNTGSTDINYLKNNTNYFKIDDGNVQNLTPDYKTGDRNFLTEAKSASNPNAAARDLWTLARDVERSHDHGNTAIRRGGVDFSDSVEVWWTLELGNRANTIRKVWDRYVVNN